MSLLRGSGRGNSGSNSNVGGIGGGTGINASGSSNNSSNLLSPTSTLTFQQQQQQSGAPKMPEPSHLRPVSATRAEFVTLPVLTPGEGPSGSSYMVRPLTNVSRCA